MKMDLIEVAQSPTLGIRAVLAARDIKKGQLIETCPVLLVPIQEEDFLEKTVLWKYYFAWNKKFDALILGYGSIYNHSEEPNAEVGFDYDQNCAHFRALTDIKKGGEIFIDYDWDLNSKRPLSQALDFDGRLS